MTTINDPEYIEVIFFRENSFYCVNFLNPVICGKSLHEQAKDHVELNPGTIRVETLSGNVLWSSQ